MFMRIIEQGKGGDWLMGNERHAAAGRKKNTKGWEYAMVGKKQQKWGSLCFSLTARFLLQKHAKTLILLVWSRSLCDRSMIKAQSCSRFSGKYNSRSDHMLYCTEIKSMEHNVPRWLSRSKPARLTWDLSRPQCSGRGLEHSSKARQRDSPAPPLSGDMWEQSGSNYAQTVSQKLWIAPPTASRPTTAGCGSTPWCP